MATATVQSPARALPRTAIPLPMDAIRAFCEKWGVAELALFGSILRDDFGPESDVDVLVTLADGAEFTLDSYCDMAAELEVIFGRDVDMIDRQTFERRHLNPLRRRRILESAEVVHAA